VAIRGIRVKIAPENLKKSRRLALENLPAGLPAADWLNSKRSNELER